LEVKHTNEHSQFYLASWTFKQVHGVQ